MNGLAERSASLVVHVVDDELPDHRDRAEELVVLGLEILFRQRHRHLDDQVRAIHPRRCDERHLRRQVLVLYE